MAGIHVIRSICGQLTRVFSDVVQLLLSFVAASRCDLPSHSSQKCAISTLRVVAKSRVRAFSRNQQSPYSYGQSHTPPFQISSDEAFKSVAHVPPFRWILLKSVK